MADIEKVIKEFEHLSNAAKGNYQDYVDLTVDGGYEIFALLKEQQKRIETLEKINAIDLNPRWPYVFNNYRKVVLCKDCRWWHESKLEQFKGHGECGQANGIPLKPNDWFCADGEKKDD